MPDTKWSMKRFFVAIVFAVTIFAVTFALGAAVTAALGPGTSGILTIIITTILIIIAAELVQARGVFTVVVTLFSILAIPTSIFGPPVIAKIGIGFVTGLAYDLVWELCGRRPRGFIVAAAVATAVSILSIFVVMTWVNHPRLDFMRKAIWYLIPLYAALGGVGAWLGHSVVWKRLERAGFVKQLQAP